MLNVLPLGVLYFLNKVLIKNPYRLDFEYRRDMFYFDEDIFTIINYISANFYDNICMHFIRVQFIPINSVLKHSSDFLLIGLGHDTSDPSSILANYTGSTIPNDVISEDTLMWIRFITDSGITSNGFSLNITAIPTGGWYIMMLKTSFNHGATTTLHVIFKTMDSVLHISNFQPDSRQLQ